MEGTDDALRALYRKGLSVARDFGCISFGLVYPSLAELNRRQTLYDLEMCGCETVQMIYPNRAE